ncbi:7593_t:CDS:2 [Acaulospora morrowiae]|uniref:7593_t:CDS:1 n=1 Tax=Acaulospora morrowiae TaxID=94023 RepID=A0A9N8V517_9GLOM|nr:7593_t:CDS:2 [Acaulospora morrowiae]
MSSCPKKNAQKEWPRIENGFGVNVNVLGESMIKFRTARVRELVTCVSSERHLYLSIDIILVTMQIKVVVVEMLRSDAIGALKVGAYDEELQNCFLFQMCLLRCACKTLFLTFAPKERLKSTFTSKEMNEVQSRVLQSPSAGLQDTPPIRSDLKTCSPPTIRGLFEFRLVRLPIKPTRSESCVGKGYAPNDHSKEYRNNK